MSNIDPSKVPQIFARQPKSVQLIQAEPIFKDLPNFEIPNNNLDTRCAQYVLNGKAFIYTLPTHLNVIDTITGHLLFKIDIPDVFEINISPLGNYITTWSKLIKDSNDPSIYLKNVNLIHLDILNKNYKILNSFLNKTQNGWIPQFTADESIICFLKNSSSLNFFKISPTNFDSSKPLNILDLKEFGKIQDFQLSTGKNPSIAVFLPAQKGNPAFIKVFSLTNLKNPVSQKQFFKGESCSFQWNSLGTSLLALVSTDVDSTNKSYYGETQLYLLDISGLFVQKINLPNEGPIHEITWSPTSREFAVIYGYMPAITTFFDSRGNSIHSLPKASRNTILYSPHAKYILVAGFGNLPGDIDILDRQNKFNKIISFQASNTSVCKWSPDGRFILTATTSPRLRVDNSIKIWYFNGSLVYFKAFNELNNVDWRYQPLSDFPPISVSKADKLDCEPDKSAIEYLEIQAKKKKSTGPVKTGAYRPPHARTTIQGNSSSSTGRSLADLQEQRQNGYLNRSVIPGFAPTQTSTVNQGSESKSAQKNRKKRANKKNELGNSSSPEPTSTLLSSSSNNTTTTTTITTTTTTATATATTTTNNNNNIPSNNTNSDSLVIGGVFSIEEKKIRNLLKKLRAIEALKAKQENMEHLEDTQLLKIQTEGSVRKELEALGWKE
jgi:translation initiation factor 2A